MKLHGTSVLKAPGLLLHIAGVLNTTTVSYRTRIFAESKISGCGMCSKPVMHIYMCKSDKIGMRKETNISPNILKSDETRMRKRPKTFVNSFDNSI